nr:DUF6596 domain-containing protein [Nakamurella leprariae]
MLLPEATVAQRVSRAKATVRAAGARFTVPAGAELLGRLDIVHQVLYLMFTEGWTAGAGPDLMRPALTAEAMRLARSLHRKLPSSSETAGLLALMLLQDSRRAARTDPDGELVVLEEQDRSRWDRAAIAEGTVLVTTALRSGPLGPYQVQAAIAAVHAEAPTAAATDWAQIVALYDVLVRLTPGPVVSLNRAVAVGMVGGPAAGLDELQALQDGPLAGHHRVAAVRAHLLARSGDGSAAAHWYREAARRAGNVREQRHLAGRAAELERRAAERDDAAR